MNLAGDMGAAVGKHDISIAHRLPSMSSAHQPVIVGSSRRVAKVDLLKKENSEEQFERVRVYEDLTKARFSFPKLHIQNASIESTWFREGTLFCK